MLDEPTSHHIVQVLRMHKGQLMILADGSGSLIEAEIIDDHRKRCLVKVLNHEEHSRPSLHLTIGISLLKNAGRFEWFLEKAAELGVAQVVPLVCARTEKDRLRMDRSFDILVSAMLQSQQAWLTHIHEPVRFIDFVRTQYGHRVTKLIAHCGEGHKHNVSSIELNGGTIVLIGPEGDFSPEEISLALEHQFKPILLGNSRLRSETAGVVAATLIR